MEQCAEAVPSRRLKNLVQFLLVLALKGVVWIWPYQSATGEKQVQDCYQHQPEGQFPLLSFSYEHQSYRISAGCYWPDVLSDVRAALQPLKIPGLGERQLSGADSYSPYRPGTAVHQFGKPVI